MMSTLRSRSARRSSWRLKWRVTRARGGGSADFLEGGEFDVERRGGAGDDALESLYLEELSLEGATEVSFG
jgi:hypothetical protein